MTIFERYLGITTVGRKAHQLAKENSAFSLIFETDSALRGTKDRLTGHFRYTGGMMKGKYGMSRFRTMQWRDVHYLKTFNVDTVAARVVLMIRQRV